MAGYLFGLDSKNSLTDAINKGLYSTRLPLPNARIWAAPQEGTFADYSTMKAGDNVYFFIDRNIYGIGVLVDINGDCKSLNFPSSNEPEIFFGFDNDRFIYLYPRAEFRTLTPKKRDNLIYDDYKQRFRYACFFKPLPFFYKDGVDMDDMLSSEPLAFKILRDFYQKSFIKIDDDENQAFKNLILRRNTNNDDDVIISNFEVSHERIKSLLEEDDYQFTALPLLTTLNNNGNIRHEAAIEAAILHQLHIRDEHTIEALGEWDYLSHQVPASPAKPSMYIDRIDIFGYSYIDGHSPTKSQFLIAELKKDTGTKEHLVQLMKYVDFIKSEYAYSDYSMITAMLIAHDFTADCVEALNDIVTRTYIHGIRPSVTRTWSKVKLIKYRYDEVDEKIRFEIFEDAN